MRHLNHRPKPYNQRPVCKKIGKDLKRIYAKRNRKLKQLRIGLKEFIVDSCRYRIGHGNTPQCPKYIYSRRAK